MPQTNDIRPDAEALLRSLRRSEEKEGSGKLTIFFGMCAGVGKTYEMLQAAQEARQKGVDVVIGFVETHGRRETEALLGGLPAIARKRVNYRDTVLEEMDIDAILARKPALVLADELAHTNAPESRHTKRYLDVEELLTNGIDVYTTLNVQHLESRSDAVAQITGALVRETVPDSIFELAHEVKLVDLSPDQLLKRLAEGKVYTAERSQRAVQNFFRKGNLTALREMALRLAAERVDKQVREYKESERIRGTWRSGHRLVVGVTPSRDSVHLIRWTRRLAFGMQASWVAVFIERSSPMSDAQKEQFAKNISLARDLGAEIITTSDDDVAAALVRVAREQNATQLIVGKSGRPWFWRKTLVERLIELSTGIDVYVAIGDETPAKKSRIPSWAPEAHSGPKQYIIAGAVVALVCAACYPFTAVIGYQTVSLILLLMVALLPLRLGAGPVLLSAALSALMWNFFFIPPTSTFVIGQPHDVVMVLAYFAVATVTGLLTMRLRSREKAVRIREKRVAALYALTNDLSSAKNQEEVLRAAVSNIKKFFNADIAIFLSDLDGDFVNKPHAASTYLPDAKEQSVPAWVHWNERTAGKFTETLPFAGATYYPLSGPRYPLGVIGVKLPTGERLSLEYEVLLNNFLSQISSALDREFLNDLTKQSIAVVESERLYTTLFNSISHEMRTPITALIGASEALAQEKIDGQPKLRRELAMEVQVAADRLDNIVQNLLAMTRLESGLIKPKLDWTDVRDVINSSIGKLHQELASHDLSVDVSPALPLVKLDFALVEQVIVNLLRNAVSYAPKHSGVVIKAFVEDPNCVISVSDGGPGFPPDALNSVFEKFYRAPGQRIAGIGLGLSIARGLVEAHHGTIRAENAPGGGATVTVRLPLEERGHSYSGAHE
jgi:two-component system, OmpR family, sensor histidine kinase KdpD